ncbi:MAG: Smr/MutS family protein [Ruminococcus sp.]|nr:Smr/MutS family protein [Ruminococcus sp.]
MYRISIDLHGLTARDAKDVLKFNLDNLKKDTREVEIIHGYHGGDRLKRLVLSYSHPKIKKKIVGLNKGSTIYEIEK